jgi:hypothetical protein
MLDSFEILPGNGQRNFLANCSQQPKTTEAFSSSKTKSLRIQSAILMRTARSAGYRTLNCECCFLFILASRQFDYIKAGAPREPSETGEKLSEETCYVKPQEFLPHPSNLAYHSGDGSGPF